MANRMSRLPAVFHWVLQRQVHDQKGDTVCFCQVLVWPGCRVAVVVGQLVLHAEHRLSVTGAVLWTQGRVSGQDNGGDGGAQDPRGGQRLQRRLPGRG